MANEVSWLRVWSWALLCAARARNLPPGPAPAQSDSDLRLNVVEGGVQLVAEKRDGPDDDDSDQGDHQAVLHCGRTPLAVEHAGNLGLDLGSNLGHDEGFLP